VVVAPCDVGESFQAEFLIRNKFRSARYSPPTNSCRRVPGLVLSVVFRRHSSYFEGIIRIIYGTHTWHEVWAI
jgi:hypothetical protein